MKIGIITWVKYMNFGSLLQAYALQRVVTKLGHQCKILDDSWVKTEKTPVGLKKRISNKIKYIIRSIIYPKYNKISEQNNVLSENFRKKHLNIEKESSDFQYVNKFYDILICGSDQIWNPSKEIFNPYYYASFFNKKKIAYAPSIGLSDYPIDFFNQNSKELLQSFMHLSTREKLSSDSLTKLLGRKVETVLDPTLLLTSEEWLSITDTNNPIKGKYLLCYFLSNNRWYVNYAKDYAKKYNLKLIIFPSIVEFSNYENIYPSGPIEFLTLIKYASVVFTDSFHGTIFSIHFQKFFVTFKRFRGNKSDNNQNSRILNLFSRLGISSDRFVDKNKLSNVKGFKTLDYFNVKNKLSKLRAESISYLKTAIIS